MSYFEIFLIAIALSMDAFAVSICQGLSLKKFKISYMLLAGAFYGVFQAIMPTLGYFLGSTFAKYVEKFDYIIAFLLLCIIGINMIREGIKEDADEINKRKDMKLKTMCLFAITTSIDAFATGVAFSFEKNINIIIAVLIIGFTTFVLAAIGIRIGHIIGNKYNKLANIVAGVVLISIGIKILIERLLFS